MSNVAESLETLVIEAAEAESSELLSRIISAFDSPEVSSGLLNACVSMLFEAWGDSIETSPLKASFCLSLAKFKLDDSHQLRNALEKTARRFAPPSIQKSAMTRIIGIRDPSVPVEKLFSRINTASMLLAERNFYSRETKIFGKIVAVDMLTEQVEIQDASTGKMRMFSIKDCLDDFLIFPSASEKLLSLSKESLCDSFGEWMKAMRDAGVNAPEAELKEMAASIIFGKILDKNNFDAWIDKGISSMARVASEQAAINRASLCQSRNLRELHHRLKKVSETKDVAPLSPDEIEASLKILSKSFGNAKSDKIAFAEAIGACISLCPSADYAAEFVKLACNSFIFTDDPEKLDRDLWGELPLSSAKPLLKNLSLVKDVQYELALLQNLPAKFIQLSNCEALFLKSLSEDPKKFRITPDVYLYAWKNRLKLGRSACDILTTDRFFKMLRQSSKNQTRKELRNLLLANPDFQAYMLALCSSEEELRIFIDAFNDSEDFTHDEKTATLVKMSRHSKALKDFLQSEKGRSAKIFRKKSDEQENAPPPPIIVSLRSYRRKARELEDIINRQIPENSAAIAHARGYGDLRENAEYSAAKERQKFLLGRRASLERELLLAKITDFTEVSVSDTVIIGSAVTLEIVSKDGCSKHSETYYLLGAWDGDPSKKILSCDSALAKELQGKKIGDAVVLGDGSSAKVVSLSPIPYEMANEYSKYEE